MDSQPLVFFHFHDFKQIGRWLYDPGLARYQVQARTLVKQHIYQPYIRGLHVAGRSASGMLGQAHTYLRSSRRSRPDVHNKPSVFRRVVRNFGHPLSSTKKLLRGELWLVVSGRIL